MNEIVEEVRLELKKHSDEKVRISSLRFFKEEIKPYGVSSADVGRISKAVFKEIFDKTKTHIFGLCSELFKSGMLEESFVACQWSYFIREQFQPPDIKVFEEWIDQYVGNWASCDTLCNHTVGAHLEMFPAGIKELKLWAKSPNRWMRRASAVSLIIPARNGFFYGDIIEIADMLLTDGDDMVRKGYGWMLKAASKPHEKDVFDYVMKNRARMPRTALRYAIEKLPPDLKKRAMAN
jgi:3-methyladenine DNA glycosylase AlkD